MPLQHGGYDGNIWLAGHKKRLHRPVRKCSLSIKCCERRRTSARSPCINLYYVVIRTFSRGCLSGHHRAFADTGHSRSDCA
jgi:hypothetical protein